ncbi:MAG: AraC family transcriptional regulator [Ginsengibacter sp.]
MRLSAHDIKCIETAKEFILADLTRHYSIPEIAEYAGININKLKVGFKLLYSSGIYNYLQERRLERGKYLLENTDKSLKEIIPLIGYKHISSFIKAFKKEYGLPPDVWRRKQYYAVE